MRRAVALLLPYIVFTIVQSRQAINPVRTRRIGTERTLWAACSPLKEGFGRSKPGVRHCLGKRKTGTF
jgi:hypothetical protein